VEHRLFIENEVDDRGQAALLGAAMSAFASSISTKSISNIPLEFSRKKLVQIPATCRTIRAEAKIWMFENRF
jgi:hypothetical protein